MKKEAAVMVLYDDIQKKVLSEERIRPDRVYYGERIFLSGLLEEGESEDPSLTAKRELQEELGVIATQMTPLESEEPIFGKLGERLYPYLITKWDGEIPEKVIDSGNPLVWELLQEVANSSLSFRALIAKLAMESLKNEN